MNPETKAIAFFESDEDARRAGFTVPLTEDEAHHLCAMPRSQRDAALATYRGSQILTKKFVPIRRVRDRRLQCQS